MEVFSGRENMEIRGVLGNFFQKNKNIVLERTKEKPTDQSMVSSKPLDLEKSFNLLVSQAQQLSKKIQKDNPVLFFQSHSFDPERALKVLEGEETGRLTALRQEVLKETVQKQNKNSVLSHSVLSQIKKISLG